MKGFIIYDQMIKELYSTFEFENPPSTITTCKSNKNKPLDFECSSIEDDFANRDRKSLNYKECSMMLIDGPLLTTDAVLYFLPRLFEAVVKEGGDAYFLSLRLTELEAVVTDSQKGLIRRAKSICEEIEISLEQSE